MFNKHCFKSYISVFMVLFLLLGSAPSVFAADNIYDTNITIELVSGINNALENVSHQKDIFGLSNVDFNSISVGSPIYSYEYSNNQLNALSYCLYPLTSNGKLVAFAIKNDNSSLFEISTVLVDKIGSKITSDKHFSIVYDKSNCYFYTTGGLICSPCGRQLK